MFDGWLTQYGFAITTKKFAVFVNKMKNSTYRARLHMSSFLLISGSKDIWKYGGVGELNQNFCFYIGKAKMCLMDG